MNQRKPVAFDTIQIVLGNSNRRFSGVTSTMLQVLEKQKSLQAIAVLGEHFVPRDVPVVSFLQLALKGRTPLANGQPRVFHARRNDEMIQALALKWLFGAKLRIAFTSTAQRHHSRFTRWLIRQMDGVISTCDAAAGYLHRPADRIIPHGVDPAVWHPAEDKTSAWQQLQLPGKMGIGIFGRVREQKGHDRLIDALVPLLKRFEDYTLVISGQLQKADQEFFSQQMEKLEQHGLAERVVYLGEVPFDELPGLFRAMHLVTALSRNEGFGLTVLEAMSSGTAVLASQAGAWPEIIRNSIDGFCVDAARPELLEKTLEQLLGQPQQLVEMGAAARERVIDSFTVDVEATALLDYYRSLQSSTGC